MYRARLGGASLAPWRGAGLDKAYHLTQGSNEREREKSIFKSPEAFYRPMLTGQLPTAQGEGGGGCEGGRGVLEKLRMSERGQETREMSTTTKVEV